MEGGCVVRPPGTALAAGLGVIVAYLVLWLRRAIPYSEIFDVHERKRMLELVVTILADSGPLTVATPARGDGRHTVAQLRRRIAA